ncbi:NADPH-dependent 2,4-dienoyl-CoA reductase, sulfur reductase [Haloarcula vallismortis]|uniref:NADH oxidase n=2 Tax=Haloarcula vallismortis TaxID=28442 RepID=M0JL56_HALVA|nr:FAD-dependent oxidoreductase [Haloarcula vallismortis]EMA09882.1 NADH oxidase [Haloarcula vallismortis ATCC 29715]SDX07082.1 NADPH-dependent 2,4-dienoyl-CoA reductase, sulfur reductase [Haloarcula vallismortis]
MTDPFVVIGGDAAGLSAASKFAREVPSRDVIVFEKGEWVSYAHCGTPYYVKGTVERLTDLLSLSPEEAADRGIDLRRNHEVVGVDTGAETVTVTHDGKTVDQPYGDLLVATGAHATTEPIPGTELDGAFTMHGLDSAAAVRAALSRPDEDAVDKSIEYVDTALVEQYTDWEPPERVAIVGGGYVGVEMAEAFRAHDVETHLFQRSSHLLPPFGKAVGERVADHLREEGVTLHLNTAVDALVGDDGRVASVAHDGSTTDVGLALVGIGIRPNTALITDTPVELGNSGAIAVNEYGATTVDGVYAAGDCAEANHAVTGSPDWVPLGLTANRAGRAIGQTVAGEPSLVGDIAGTAVVKAFDLECGRVGLLDHERASAAGFDPVSKTVTTGSRSGYYPGGDDTDVTLVADRKSGRLLGGAIVGEDRAAIRIDTLATAIEADMTVDELERLDLAYAPPFSPVWDPVLVAAKVLTGQL